MDPQAVRTIASDIVLISIGLFAATLIVMGPTWKRFQTCWEQTSSEGRDMVFRSFVTAFVLGLLFLVPVAIALWINPHGWFYELPYITFLLAVVAIVILGPIILFWVAKWLCKWVWDKLRNRPTAERIERPDFTREMGIASSLTFFIYTIILLTFSMFAAVDVAIGVNVSLEQDNQQKNFEFARAMVRLAPGLFFGGLLFLSMSYLADIKKKSELDSKGDCP